MARESSGKRELKFRGASGLWWFYLSLMIGGLAIGILLLSVGAIRNRTAPLVTGIALTPLFALLVLFGALPILRQVTVTDTILSIPRFIRGKKIPVSQIMGVGLLYRRTPHTRAPEGWFLEVWESSGAMTQLGQYIVTSLLERTPPKSGEKRSFIRFGRDLARPLPHEDAAVLAATRPGRIATEIYEWVLSRQGPNGPLATRAAQKSATYEGSGLTQNLAWWSPDGTMGRLRT